MSIEPLVTLWGRGGWWEALALRRLQPPFEPRNTWSNLAYAIVGVGAAWWYGLGESAVFAVAMVMLATGSALYHATKTLPANRADWMGMMAVGGVLVPHGWLPVGTLHAWVMLLVGGGMGLWYTYQSRTGPDGKPRRLHFDHVVAGMVALASVYPMIHGQWRLTLGAWGLFGLAYLCWQGDRRRWSPLRVWGMWGHAAWHVLTAVAFGVLYHAQHLAIR